ncbi:MAG: type II toxin-antitoxin system VapC family toxin [bacterium]|nr:type II toxin-antitoxin system VapC family toxin [bacterium]
MQEEKLTLYLDTSIPSAYYDTSKPVRQLMTQKWFEHKALFYELYTSVTTIDEIEELDNSDKRQNIKDLLVDYHLQILELSHNAVTLANEYLEKGAIPPSEPEDAYHVAIASVHRLDGLASWNFKHIVSMNPIRKIHEINLKHGYPIIEIGSLELFGGAEYGNI